MPTGLVAPLVVIFAGNPIPIGVHFFLIHIWWTHFYFLFSSCVLRTCLVPANLCHASSDTEVLDGTKTGVCADSNWIIYSGKELVIDFACEICITSRDWLTTTIKERNENIFPPRNTSFVSVQDSEEESRYLRKSMFHFSHFLFHYNLKSAKKSTVKSKVVLMERIICD